ncbi:phenoloxidase-activating factor 2-like [Lucilia cuprina]|uniref:phenoloxidase-activating factor 2-like n=1 Tax=Lucilia cuprina TaxID=7375 RepID=UPI000C719411|nr:phenoloxidase-activating factor 2-like [Lucilia cuprina]XP_023299929.1 phenoloxidase-activating factor 2-like [Lucilia cuprina]KAI8119218.1 Serine proteinase stubble [Lucilia cuprina]
MTAKVSLIVFSLLIAHSFAQLSLDDLIGQVFNNNTPLVESTTQVFRPTPTKTTVLGPPRSGESGGYRACGVDKECVPRHLCVDGSISTTGENFIDIRINDDVCSYSEICCDIPNKRSEPVIPPFPKERHEGCGWRNNDGVGFKITGDTDNESQFGEFPWMVAILRTEDAGGEIIHLYDCGGSLIAPNVVLTASHCVINRKAQQLVVRGGEWDTQNTNEILNHVDKPVREIIIHENYNKGALYNDVALLILEDGFVWQENIRPICLPEPNANFDHSRCFATGWGKDKFGREGKYQVILKKIDLPVVPQDTCQKYLRDTRLGLYFNLHESFICAGGEKDKDTCKGDGGSPLVCPIPGVKDRYYQAGIVAWGVGCAEENVPGVYANVPYLRPWISEKLAARGISFAPFTP